MKKGFIGPIGDDLPSIVALMLALGLFFTGMIYAFNSYNEKIDNMEILKGSVEIGRALIQDGILTEDKIMDNKDADFISQSYGLEYDVFLDEVAADACTDSYRFSYLVAVKGTDGMELRKMILCTWT